MKVRNKLRGDGWSWVEVGAWFNSAHSMITVFEYPRELMKEELR